MHRKGYTLAEILITLGIIGIIAAITIQLITNAYQRIVYPNQLKAVYSRLTNAQKSINDEFGPPEDWSYSSHTRPDEGNANNLSILERYATELGAIAWTKKRGNYNYHYYGISNAPKKLNGKPATNRIKDWIGGLYEGNYCYQMLLKNGTSLAIIFSDEPGGATFWNFIGKGYYAAFIVDINGLGKPNMLGRDIFVFALTKGYSSIVPYSTDTSDCNKNEDGLSCSKKIIDDGWKMTY